LLAKDWSIRAKARSILLSGNLTQSCIGKEGDGLNLAVRPKESIPNANHMIIVDSQELALVIQHELTKTIVHHLRGRDYNLGGAFKIMGPKVEGRAPSYMIIAFTPGGGLGDVNRDIIAQVIGLADGPMRMVQFAASSQTITDALFRKMEAQVLSGKEFDFSSIADTPFAMAEWSLFLEISGFTIETLPDGTKRWVEPKDNIWKKVMGERAYQEFRDKVLVAPEVYGHHMAKQPDGTVIELTSKIHHKLLLVKINGKWVGIQGSYNFSEGALKNQEYITIIVDHEAGEFLLSIFEGLKRMSKRQFSVAKMAEFRNSRKDDRDPNRKVIRDSESEEVLKPRSRKPVSSPSCRNLLGL
ncbi:MAG: hypothetical protein ABL958_21670, partial [Bdellovibrionia bacterium]